MVLNIYIDDLTLDGAARLHGQFWKFLHEKIKFESEAEVLPAGIRILGRLYRSYRTSDGPTLTLDMNSYAQQVEDLYAELADAEKDSLKAIPIPYLAESAIVDDDSVAGHI